MRLRRFTPLWLVILFDVVAVIVWIWIGLFAGLDEDQAVGIIVWGIFFGFPILGIASLFAAIAIHVIPYDTPPRGSWVRHRRTHAVAPGSEVRR